MNDIERIACHRLQLEGLLAWPESPEKRMMIDWVLRKIASLQRS